MCSVQHLIKAVGALGSRAGRGALPARPRPLRFPPPAWKARAVVTRSLELKFFTRDDDVPGEGDGNLNRLDTFVAA
ncbi:hypothetical protein MSG28_012432 [Choristoneura fumiferana]|uniref:Uncharacterized protein n=1 Tax=Choristoneura fumiferana TaxID=7141 RepID=A0ACC0KD72_CHOFU|nr:hypothetical protein MSG28_012432 [Choristoneura fumiferana]